MSSSANTRASRGSFQKRGVMARSKTPGVIPAKGKTMIAGFALERTESKVLKEAETVEYTIVDSDDSNEKIKMKVPKYSRGDREDWLLWQERFWRLAVTKDQMNNKTPNASEPHRIAPHTLSDLPLPCSSPQATT